MVIHMPKVPRRAFSQSFDFMLRCGTIRALVCSWCSQVACPMSSPAPQPASIDDPLSDERWQLVQRILASPAFQKSGRLRDLLQYITEQTIRGYAYELTEHHIGEAVFHKPAS